jgi:glucokinase
MEKVYAIGMDVGGTHITSAIINVTDMMVLKSSVHKECFNSNLPVNQVMDFWEKSIRLSLKNSGVENVKGIAVCIPGPFDYVNGISLIKGQDKYENFYGLNIGDLIKERLSFPSDYTILFENDAVCFGKGEVYKDIKNLSKKVMAVTLGTGLGSCFIDNGVSISSGIRVPIDGEIWDLPFKEGIAEDYVSLRGLLLKYFALTGIQLESGLELFNRATVGDQNALKAFEEMGEDLAEIVFPCLKKFSGEHFIIGGKIANSSSLFLPSFNKKISEKGYVITIQVSSDNEDAALLGAASMFSAL